MTRPAWSEAQLRAIAQRFALESEPTQVARHAGGHINDSFRVNTAREGLAYLLQRVNPAVFPDFAAVMHNVALVTNHVRAQRAGDPDVHRRCLRLIPTADGATHWIDPEGAAWRVFRFIDGAHAQLAPRGPEDARTAGYAFGEFLTQLSDLPIANLRMPIPGFHDTPARCARLDEAIEQDVVGRAAGARAEIDFYRAHRGLADALVKHSAAEMPRRAVHNDAKLSNVLLDDRTGEALCVADLDLVMPGVALFDFGDMVRSMTSPAAEDESNLSRVTVRWDFFEALRDGFLEAAGDWLTCCERAQLLTAGRVITFEQGVRFLADHLCGDRYYAISRPSQNLDRARVQFRLVELLGAPPTP